MAQHHPVKPRIGADATIIDMPGPGTGAFPAKTETSSFMGLNWLSLFIGVAILLIVAIAAYVYFTKEDAPDDPEPLPKATPKPAPTVSPQAIAEARRLHAARRAPPADSPVPPAPQQAPPPAPQQAPSPTPQQAPSPTPQQAPSPTPQQTPTPAPQRPPASVSFQPPAPPTPVPESPVRQPVAAPYQIPPQPQSHVSVYDDVDSLLQFIASENEAPLANADEPQIN